MNKIQLLAAAPAQPAGRILGIFEDGDHTDHEQLFTVRSPFPGEPTIQDGRNPENGGAGRPS